MFLAIHLKQLADARGLLDSRHGSCALISRDAQKSAHPMDTRYPQDILGLQGGWRKLFFEQIGMEARLNDQNDFESITRHGVSPRQPPVF